MNKIDLSKNQLVEGDVKVRYWYDNEQLVKEGYLALVNHKCVKAPYRIWDDGKKAINNCFNVFYTTPCKHVELIEPKYRVKDFYSLVETLKNEDYKLKGKTFHSEKRELPFVIEMFEYCGQFVENNEFADGQFFNGKYYFKESWLEEVEE